MKNRPTTPPRTVIKRAVTTSTLVAAAVFMALNPAIQTFADKFDDQINAIQGEVSAYQGQAAVLAQQADTLQNKVNSLNVQKAAIQAQVDLSQAKYDQLVQQIADNEAKLLNQQQFLADTLTQLYVDSDTSTVEMLAGSASIGDIISKEDYRTTIRNQALSAIEDVKTLKAQLAKQQVEVKQVLADQTSQRNDLAAREAEQAQLLADTQGQESAYQAQIGSKNAQISDLRSQQRAANSRLGGAVAGDPNHGAYPNNWYSAPKDSLTDDWGMYNRECVSYTAWKVFEAGKYMPYWGGHGNANQWPASARADGIPTGGTPRVHSVAISMAGGYGHSMWVEAVNGDGSIYVSQMNFDLNGSYSEMRVSAGTASNLTYIYF